jgi:hypothetical protein
MNVNDKAAVWEAVRIAREDAEDLQLKLLKICAREAKKSTTVESAALVLFRSSVGLVIAVIKSIAKDDVDLAKRLYLTSGERIWNEVFLNEWERGENDGLNDSDP